MVQPNAGLPVLENMKAVYKQLPADMAKDVPDALAAGRQHHRLLLRQHARPHPRHSWRGGEIQSYTSGQASLLSYGFSEPFHLP